MGLFDGSMGRLACPVLAGVCLALFVDSAHSQQPPPEPPPAPIIKSIDVEYTGPATVSKERILAQLRTRVGEPYSDQIVENDIRNLYKTGAVLNVRIFAKPIQDGSGVRVTVAIQTRSTLREIIVDGAHKVSAKRIRKEIVLKINQPVNEEELE